MDLWFFTNRRKSIYSVPESLLTWLNLQLDPHLVKQTDPYGSQNVPMTQERYQESQLWQYTGLQCSSQTRCKMQIHKTIIKILRAKYRDAHNPVSRSSGRPQAAGPKFSKRSRILIRCRGSFELLYWPFVACQNEKAELTSKPPCRTVQRPGSQHCSAAAAAAAAAGAAPAY